MVHEKVAPVSAAQIHKAVYVKLRTLEVSEAMAERIAQAAYGEFIKIGCEQLARQKEKQ